MAPGHVPNDQGPLQGHVYPDPTSATYDHLFSRANQYTGTPSWDQFSQSHSTLLPQSSGAQSWHHNLSQQSYPSASSPYSHANQGYQASPSYQYAQFSNHGSISSYGQQSAVDPALSQDPGAARAQQLSPYQPALRTVTPQGQPTVSPQALQHGNTSLQNARPASSPYQIPKTTSELFAQRASPTSSVSQPVSNPKYELPKGKVSGGFSLIDQAALAKATNSIALNKFVNIGTQPMHLATNRTALPIYTSRQSVKDLKKSQAGTKRLLDKVTHRPSAKILVSKSAASRLGSTALQRSASDSESYSETDESDYTDSEDEEESPLPASRPDDPHQAVRYDIIKSTWFPQTSQPGPGKIKTSLAELWEVLNTIQKRWRADSKAVSEAEEQKKTGELPVLKQRVSGQRDLLRSALKSVLEFSHADVLYHLGQVKPFLYLCYQFLANRFKMQDYDGELSSVIYQVLARAGGTLTTELLDETKLVKALNSMKKNANEANKALIQQIVEAAAAGSKKPKVSSLPPDDAVDSKNGKRPATVPPGRSPTEEPAVKRVKPSDPPPGPPKKVMSGENAPKAAANATVAPQKRPGEKSSAAAPKPRATQVVNKPSSFFSSLNVASKKPGPAAAPVSTTKPATQRPAGTTAVKDKKPVSAPAAKPAFSFAATMAQLLEPKKEATAAPKPEKQLPPETAEEKAKRLRKESRRHLRVSFRPDATLVDIRYFSHDPEEEEGHDENFLRDAGDIGGEGRMFKQHRDMVEDDEDEEESELLEREWKEPSAVDFTVVSLDERARNFEPYGGGERKPECPEKEANQQRENSALMVTYIDRSDIPPSPREPPETDTERSVPVREFGFPEKGFILERLPKPPAPAPNIDFNFLESVVGRLATANQPPPPPVQNIFAPQPPAAPPAPPTNNLSAILSALNVGANQQTALAAPASTVAPMTTTPALPGIDVNAILSAMQQQQAQAAPSALPAFPPVLPPWMAQPFQQPFQQQQQPQADSAFLQQQQQGQYNQNANGGTKRQRDEGNNHGNDRGHGSFKKQKNVRNHTFMGERPHKVLACKFYPLGKCTKGDDCTFIHDLN